LLVEGVVSYVGRAAGSEGGRNNPAYVATLVDNNCAALDVGVVVKKLNCIRPDDGKYPF